ncbi:hypothetical protein QKW52_18335 [Bacillus sonorensis]|nr:hypothetical protein [Bacillus sonorensis]
MPDTEAEFLEGIHSPLETKRKEFMQNYELTFLSLNETHVQVFLEQLQKCQKIYFYGAGFSTTFSNYLAKRWNCSATMYRTPLQATAALYFGTTSRSTNYSSYFHAPEKRIV